MAMNAFTFLIYVNSHSPLPDLNFSNVFSESLSERQIRT